MAWVADFAIAPYCLQLGGLRMIHELGEIYGSKNQLPIQCVTKIAPTLTLCQKLSLGLLQVKSVEVVMDFSYSLQYIYASSLACL